jgi:hypothetical protein
MSVQYKVLRSNMMNQLLHIYKYFNDVLLYSLVKNNVFLNVLIVGSSRCQYVTVQLTNLVSSINPSSDLFVIKSHTKKLYFYVEFLIPLQCMS